MRILITGGAGFVGSNLALALSALDAGHEIVALDSLVRLGSELAPDRLRPGGVAFERGDVRDPRALRAAGPVDCIIDCSAEPSVQAGYDGASQELVDVNLGGTVHCLELAREYGAALILLSTSRVYSIEALRALPLEERGTRLELSGDASGPGWSRDGIAEAFSTASPRSLYGTTKLCSEQLVQEYGAMFGLRTVVNRCAVIAGPWQMGRVDQGFVSLWAASHLYGGELAYRGFGGRGTQVRDILHVDDLCDLVALQLADLDRHTGQLYCVGGGPERALSLRELSAHCAKRSGEALEFGSVGETHPADIPWFVNDNRALTERTGWRPERSLDDLLDDVFAWLREHRAVLEPRLGPNPRREEQH